MKDRLRIIGAIIGKDVREFTRDRFFVLITILGLGAYILVFWLLPATVDESVSIGVRGVSLDAVGPIDTAQGQALDVVGFATTEELASAVEEGADGLVAGLAFPDDFLARTAAGERTTVTVMVRGDTPGEIRGAMTAFVREIAYTIAGAELPVTQLAQEEVVLGVDRMGDQASIRDQMRPLLAFFILLVETFALASLVAGEVSSRTVVAVLATPARSSDFLAAKAILGTLLAFSEAALLMLAIRSFGNQPVLLLVALLLGAALVTGFGLIAGSTGKDFISVLFWSILFMVPLAVPAFTAMFPGSVAGWVRVLPTMGLVEAIVGVTTYGEGWGDVLPDLAMLFAWCVVILAAGVVILKRKVETL